MNQNGFQIAPLHYFLVGEAQAPEQAGTQLRKNPVPMRGPADGQLGILCTPCAGFAPCEYRPEEQTWREISGKGKEESGKGGAIWLGVAKDLAPHDLPALFARAEQRPGHLVRLGDGRDWQITPARLALGGSGLPRRRVLQDDGARGWAVEEAYRHLAEQGERIWQQLNGQPSGLTDADVDAICGAALAVNYRLGTIEALALGLLTDAGITKLLEALVDMPTVHQILEAQKKSTDIPGS